MGHSSKENRRVEILMSTVNSHRLSIDAENYIIINQITDKSIPKKEKENVFSYRNKGLSKSRNKALQHAKGDICLITDDDVQFTDNVENIIWDTFKENPKADIITFQIQTPEGNHYKNYPNKKYWHDPNSLMNISSIEIAFRRDRVIEKKLEFDELFGLGSIFPTGEEYIFLTDALKKGLKILYVPKVIVIHPNESSGQNWQGADFIKAKGAMLYRVFGWKALYWLLILSFKKYGHSEFTFSNYFSCMLGGIRQYKSYSKPPN